MYEEETIECIECGEQFPFTARGKEFFERMGFVKPKRCAGCRANSGAKLAANGASVAG